MYKQTKSILSVILLISILTLSACWTKKTTLSNNNVNNSWNNINVTEINNNQNNITNEENIPELQKTKQMIKDLEDINSKWVKNNYDTITKITEDIQNNISNLQKVIKNNKISQIQKNIIISSIKSFRWEIKKAKNLKNKLSLIEKDIKNIKQEINNYKDNWKNSNFNVIIQKLKKLKEEQNQIINELWDITNKISDIYVSTQFTWTINKIEKNISNLPNIMIEKIKKLDKTAITVSQQEPNINDTTILNLIKKRLKNNINKWEAKNNMNMNKLWKICSIKPNEKNIIINWKDIYLVVNNSTLLYNYIKWCKLYNIAKDVDYTLNIQFINMNKKIGTTSLFTIWWPKLKWDIYNVTLMYFLKYNPSFLSHVIKQYWQWDLNSTIQYLEENDILTNFIM